MLTEPSLEGDESLVYDDVKKTVTAKGNAILRSSEFLLVAEEIKFDRNQSMVSATEKVILSAHGYRILCDRIILDLQTGNFDAQDVKTGSYPWVLETKQLSRKNGMISFGESFLSNRKGTNLGPNIHFPVLDFDENKSQFISEWSWMKQGNRKIFPILPIRYNSDLNQSLRGNFLIGKKNNLGWYVGTRAGLKSSTSKADLEIIGYSRRGFLLSPEISFSSDLNSIYSSNASFEFGWIRDQDDNPGMDRRNLPFSKDRNYLDASFISQFNNSWRLAGQFQQESDSEMFREFRSERFEKRQWLNNFAELSWEHPNGGISGLHRWQVNQHEAQIEQSPTLRLDFGPFSLPSQSTYHSVSVEYSNLRKKDEYGAVQDKSRKLDYALQTYHPLELAQGITYIPSYTIRNQSYELGQNDASRAWSEWGNELRLFMYADYDFENKTWGIEGIRHSMNFVLRHHKIHSLKDKNIGLIPKIDVSAFSLNLDPMNLLDIIEADDLVAHEALRLEWTNSLLTSDGRDSNELVRILLAQDLWVKDKDYGMFKPTFYSNFEINPAEWLQLRAKSKVNNSPSTSRIHTLSIFLFDGKDREYGISYLEYLNFGGQWMFETSVIIDPNKKVSFSARYDAKSQSFPYWRGLFEFSQNHEWVYLLSLSQRKGTLRENELELNLGLRLYSY